MSIFSRTNKEKIKFSFDGTMFIPPPPPKAIRKVQAMLLQVETWITNDENELAQKQNIFFELTGEEL